MNAQLVDGIVKAVLYEGYMLYPYRPSSLKNRQRFNFGVIYPCAYSEAQGGTDACTMQTDLNAGDTDIQRLCCLANRQFFNISQKENLSIDVG